MNNIMATCSKTYDSIILWLLSFSYFELFTTSDLVLHIAVAENLIRMIYSRKISELAISTKEIMILQQGYYVPVKTSICLQLNIITCHQVGRHISEQKYCFLVWQRDSIPSLKSYTLSISWVGTQQNSGLQTFSQQGTFTKGHLINSTCPQFHLICLQFFILMMSNILYFLNCIVALFLNYFKLKKLFSVYVSTSNQQFLLHVLLFCHPATTPYYIEQIHRFTHPGQGCQKLRKDPFL